MRKLFCVALLVPIFGCAGHVLKSVQVTSTPPGANIDLDGVRIGQTPLNYEQDCGRSWVGLFNSSSGWRSESQQQVLEVFPTAPKLYSQRKFVNICQASGNGVTIDFDLRLHELGSK